MSSGDVREVCEVCDFEWAVVRPQDVRQRILDAVGELATIIQANAADSANRPEPSRWSALEYCAHVRDVLLLVRDRLVLMVIENEPTPFPLYREERVNLGLYANESPRSVSDGMEVAAQLFTGTFETLRHDYLDRTLVYGYPIAAVRTLGWTGAQVVHECEHHLSDVRENIAELHQR